MNEKKALLISKITRYIVCFILAGLIGWLYEIVMGLIVWGKFFDRGVLHLPLCPIYGFGVLLILAAVGKKRTFLRIFIYGTVLSTVLELVASYLLEWIFHLRLWDYELWPLQFQGRISLPSSLIFGLFSVLMIGLVYPLISKGVSKLPPAVQVIHDVVMLGAVVLDAAITIHLSISTVHISFLVPGNPPVIS